MEETMIIIKHLTIERFRLLRSMNLHFPQRGSILIQGPNEAGKSALIESIYFALYGEPLLLSRGKHLLDDLILYGATNAYVALTLSVGATELSVARTIERGHGQTVTLQMRRLGLPEEAPITDLAIANACIIAELGRINGEVLRNSCLIEQKGLKRLESIVGVEREATIRKLLGLEKFLELKEHFQVGPENEALLQECAEYLRLTEMQVRIPQVSEELERIEAALDAVAACESLDAIDQQESEITELEQMLTDIQARRLTLRGRQHRIQQLKKADATLAEIIASYDEMAEARHMLPDLEEEIAELERQEREDLPKLEKRVSDLAELTRSFGTLQRMSNDLLTTVDGIKGVEQEYKQYSKLKEGSKALEEQVAQTRTRLTTIQKALQDLEERRHSEHPQLGAHLQRLDTLSDSLAKLRRQEEQYTQRVASRTLAEENAIQLNEVQKKLLDAEQELEVVEREAQRVQARASSVEKTWRQLNIRLHLGDWCRLKDQVQGLALAQQHVDLGRMQQKKLNDDVDHVRQAGLRYTIFVGVSIIVVMLCLLTILLGFSPWLTIVAIIVMFAAIGIGALNFRQYRKAHAAQLVAQQRLQEATGRISMMVAVRETAARTSGSMEALLQTEEQLRSLGAVAPTTLEEARRILEQIKDLGDPIEVQQRLKESMDEANAARDQVNATTETVTALHKEYTRLEEQRRSERWDAIEEDIVDKQAAIERMQQEIVMLAGQESFPVPSINARLQVSPIAPSVSFSSGAMLPVPASEDITAVPELDTLVESTIEATEREIAALDGKLGTASDLTAQIKVYEAAIDVLLVRQQALEEQMTSFPSGNPEERLEHAREQQSELRNALQSLQDSLRQRVKPLGVTFGQTAVGNAESVARKQLEELHITLGNKMMQQECHAHFSTSLRERQESLTDLYKQLAKLSNALGSWVVPLNPFAEALIALRKRCEQELQEANEQSLLQEFDTLKHKEAASNTKVALCRQEISNAQSAIAALLEQRGRPQPASYARADLVVVWSLLDAYSAEDRSDLEQKQAALENELSDLEQQELELSTKLGVQNKSLDLQEARNRMQQQERLYQVKKHGNLLIKEVDRRLLHKMLPRTEYYMQQILPQLTGGRYHDVHLETEPEQGTLSGGPCQIQVWDSAASAYVPTSALSAGAADQLSLALRLAFTIATLPRELNVAPGFILLDEPLSSFDRGRAQALVDVITGELLSQHFEQILLIAHSSAFEPAMFPYHIYMDNGTIVASNLPVVPTIPLIPTDNNPAEAQIPVIVGSRSASTDED
jgi:DNA repair exonuclease SbcCD ATPase subunit